MKIAIYARVSTGQQTAESQIVELRAEASRRGWTVAAEITDSISGSKFTRTGLEQLLKLVRAHSVKAILCAKLDRLGRSLQHLAQLIDEFAVHGVALVCPSQGIDTSDMNSAARFQMQILAAVAEFERQLIRERTIAGLNAAKARGVRLGRPRTRLPENTREIVALWRRETGGANYRDLARRLGIPNPGTAFRAAKSAAMAA